MNPWEMGYEVVQNSAFLASFSDRAAQLLLLLIRALTCPRWKRRYENQTKKSTAPRRSYWEGVQKWPRHFSANSSPGTSNRWISGSLESCRPCAYPEGEETTKGLYGLLANKHAVRAVEDCRIYNQPQAGKGVGRQKFTFRWPWL